MHASTYYRALLSLTLLTAACTGDDKGGTDTETTETTEATGTTSEGTSQGSTSVMSTTGTATTETSTSGMTEGTGGTESTGSDSTSEGTTEGTTGVMDVCAPGEDAKFKFELQPAPEFKDLTVEWICKALDVTGGEDGALLIAMSCTQDDVAVEPPPMLVITTSPATELAGIKQGSALRVFYYQAAPWWLERWIRVEDLLSGELLLAGIDGPTFEPSPKVEVAAPVALSVIDGACTPIEGDCGAFERLQVDAMAEGVMSAHLDGTFAIAGGDPGYSVWVERAARLVGEAKCSDLPERWYSVGVIADGQE